MKKFVASVATLVVAMSSTAMAADLGVITQPAPASYVAADWTGFYAGIFGGVSTGPIDFSAIAGGGGSPLELSFNAGGFIGGAQVGYDVQMGQFVLGAVVDAGLSNHRAAIEGGVGGGVDVLEARLAYLATVRARAGYAFDDVLAYVHGGAAYGRTEINATSGGVPLSGASLDRIGFVVGAGVEYKVTESISLQTEYSYTGFGAQTVFASGGDSLEQGLGIHTVKAGVNYRF